MFHFNLHGQKYLDMVSTLFIISHYNQQRSLGIDYFIFHKLSIEGLKTIPHLYGYPPLVWVILVEIWEVVLAEIY